MLDRTATGPVQTTDPTTALGQEILGLIRAGDEAEAADEASTKTADEKYKAAGSKLIEAQKQEKNFEAFLAALKKQGGLSRSRAYELMSIARGETTLEEVRAKNRERKARQRRKNPKSNTVTTNGVEETTEALTNGEAAEETETEGDAQSVEEETEGVEGSVCVTSRTPPPRPRRGKKFDAEPYASHLSEDLQQFAYMLDEYEGHPEGFAAVIDHLAQDAFFIEALTLLARNEKVRALVARAL